MMYPFCFAAVVTEGFDEELKKYTYVLDSGMGFAKSYSDAAAQVESYYGDDLVSINKLELFENTSLMFFPQRVIDEYRKDSYAGVPCDLDGNPIREERVYETIALEMEHEED